MSNFKFRLTGVQKLRERLRDEAADSLQQARLAVQKLTDQLGQLQDDFQTQAKYQADASSGVIDHQRVLESQRYQMHLLAEMQTVQGNISLVEQECDRRQQILVKREQDVRALEKLRDAQHSQWQYTQNVASQSRLDEWAGFRFWKNAQKSTNDTAQ